MELIPPILLLCHHLSLHNVQAACGLAGVTRPRPRGGDASKRGGCNVGAREPRPYSHTISLPHAPCSPGQRSRLAADIAADAGALLPHPFSRDRGSGVRGQGQEPDVRPLYPTPYTLYPGWSTFCCRLASHHCCQCCAPAYGFAGWLSRLHAIKAESREVPLGCPSGGLFPFVGTVQQMPCAFLLDCIILDCVRRGNHMQFFL